MENTTPDQSIEAEEAARTSDGTQRRAGHIEQAYDRRDSRLIGGVSAFGIVLGASAGAAVGLIVALIVDVDLWWAGVLIGGFTGAVVGALVPVRFALQGLEREARPPEETTEAAAKAPPR
jgi:hypothetical protein